MRRGLELFNLYGYFDQINPGRRGDQGEKRPAVKIQEIRINDC